MTWAHLNSDYIIAIIKNKEENIMLILKYVKCNTDYSKSLFQILFKPYDYILSDTGGRSQMEQCLGQ